MIHYRFRSSTTWHTLHTSGSLTTTDLSRHVQVRHGLQRVIVESDLGVLRPDTWIVVRNVPKHWVARPAAKPALTEPPRGQAERPDDPAVFGPDPMDARPIQCIRRGARMMIL